MKNIFRSPPKPRWKLLLFLLAIPLSAMFAFQLVPRLEETGFGGAVAFLGIPVCLLVFLAWLLLFSRLPWRSRLIGLVGAALTAVALFGLVRVEGHMGDFFWQWSWRWQPKAGESLDAISAVGTQNPGSVRTGGSGDSLRFLGSQGTNHVSGKLLPGNWTTTTPKELWRRRIGTGWSGFSVAGDHAVTQEQRDDKEMVVCYHLQTGRPLWGHEDLARFEESMGGNGPRATPTIVGDRVYTLGATGILNCLDLRTGKPIWRRETLREAGQENITWAKSASPLWIDNKIVVSLGKGSEGTLAAFRADDGEPLWQAGSDSASYATPIVATLGGLRQIVNIFANKVSGHAIESGDELWSHPCGGAPANVANPLPVDGERLLVMIGYGVGSKLLRVKSKDAGKLHVELLWETMKMKPKFTNPVLFGDHIFGLDEGRLACVEVESGERVWKKTRTGHGQVLGIGENLLVQHERGGILIVAADSSKERILHKFDALGSKTWNQPTLAGRYLLVRNDREAVCFYYGEDE